MARFYPLFVRRSDGKKEVIVKNKREPNEPIPEQLDRAPNSKGVCDYYREVDPLEPKHLDWRRKLGGMLMKELGGAQLQDRACILYEFPEGYRLYEHVKYRVSEADKKEKSTKNHSGGGNDRQDAYLYGHPSGRKKRYRSPMEFFPHLLWLATDPAGDPMNCACRICAPEEYQPDEKPAKQEIKAEPQVKVEGKQTVAGTDPQVVIPSRPGSQGIPSRPASAAATSLTPAMSAQTLAIAPTPLPKPRSIDQDIDLQHGKFLYRQGECIWYSRGQAWGLGVVLRRYFLNPLARQHSQYVVQPLSHPLEHPGTSTVGEPQLRPWLAWSVPPMTNEGLRHAQYTYENIDWLSVVQGRYGKGNAEVDGSILAAKIIDRTYSFFELKSHAKPQPGTEEYHWNGMYLGGEKMWCGEPIRLRMDVSAGSFAVLVIIDIIEVLRAGFGPNNGTSTVTIVGDVYTWATVPSGMKQPNDDHLPVRMREDLRWRNNITMQKKGQSAYWKLVRPQARIGIGEIKGRWYESSLLLPHIQAGNFDADVQSGDIKDSGFLLNTRGDTNAEANKLGTRMPERVVAFGRAVPRGTQLIAGFGTPAQEPQLPPGSHSMHQQQQPLAQPMEQHDAPGIEDFMNLDSMDHGNMPGFADDLNFHDTFTNQSYL